MWRILAEEYNRIVKLYVPTMNRDRRKRKPLWWNKEIVKARKNKLRWWKQYQETECCTDYLKYKKEINRARKLIRKAKRRCEERITRRVKEDPKAYYKYASSKMKAKVSVGPLEDENRNIICDDK